MDIEAKVKEMGNRGITTTQLRLLLSNAVVLKNKIDMEVFKTGSDKLSPKLQNEVKYLLVKHIYQCGRDNGVKNFDRTFKISDMIKDIGDSVQRYNDFYRYLEEIVAYTKYHRG